MEDGEDLPFVMHALLAWFPTAQHSILIRPLLSLLDGCPNGTRGGK